MKEKIFRMIYDFLYENDIDQNITPIQASVLTDEIIDLIDESKFENIDKLDEIRKIIER